MTISLTAGATFHIGPTTAAADATAYAALSYTEIKHVESLGEVGDAAEITRFNSLSEARTKKLKGTRDAGDLQLVVARDPLDTGQLAAIAAEATDFDYAFKLVLSDAADANDPDSVYYFHAKVAGKRTQLGGANDVTKRTHILAINTAVIEVPSVATA